jgi:hypothetical protein
MPGGPGVEISGTRIGLAGIIYFNYMSDVLVLTGYDNAIKPLGDLTSISAMIYAVRNSFDFHCERTYHSRMHPSFQKVECVLSGLLTHRYVIWIDSDAIVTNFDFTPITKCWPGINVSKDWGKQIDSSGRKIPDYTHFSMGIFVATRAAAPVFWYLLQQKQWYFKIALEQAALQEGVENYGWIRDLVHVHPRRFLNSVDAHLGEIIDPETGRLLHEDNPVLEPWQPGDFICHVTGRSLEEKLKQVGHYLMTGGF